jgi:hypothetical protein
MATAPSLEVVLTRPGKSWGAVQPPPFFILLKNKFSSYGDRVSFLPVNNKVESAATGTGK